MNVVLFEPEIAANTGNIARTCLATGTTLHLIRPLGFQLDEYSLKRAGMDYWQEVDVKIHPSFTNFQEMFSLAFAKSRVFALTTKAKRSYSDAVYCQGDVLIFGPESRGLPENIRQMTTQLRIPMTERVRSLNLAASVSIVLYECWRQLDFEFDA